MTRDEIKAKIREIMSNELNLTVSAILDEESKLFEDLGIDSLMVMQIAVYVEEQFEVVIPDETWEPSALTSVGSLVDFVENLLEGEPV
ncbi:MULTISPECIES: phosphopantetheine-binding protein [Paenibacillus]|uniref:Acyl carrier protein n=1 Tax=Paenibacillus cucumis (ex Kampfer et al. 2016) TaxID=1776858 RepID=A0ABS7KT26_9BACL|nr:phosphopantetheine-binding protein [Paenibacillus cucumis (ex Kampfer et al. 2016)]MBY0207117.1 acyl carrier protein [Paenibacillus cucumis (ex Kampfer et al. 2016)]MDP9698983.1 acyl carrier protein [Paenibacillus intestini]